MKVVVLVKQTFDTEAKILLDDRGTIDSKGVNLIMNPYDEFAVEEALRIKERLGGDVLVVSAGDPQRISELMRQKALAMGADRALVIDAADQKDSAGVARSLAAAIRDQGFDLILAGHVAIDDNAAEVPVRVAEELGLPQVTMTTRLEVSQGKAVATREAEGEEFVIEIDLPAVVTVQKGINEPRFPSVKGIMQAKKKELTILPGSGGDVPTTITILGHQLPPSRGLCHVIRQEAHDAARELVNLLHHERGLV